MPGTGKPWVDVEQARTTAAGKYERNFGEWAVVGGAAVERRQQCLDSRAQA